MLSNLVYRPYGPTAYSAQMLKNAAVCAFVPSFQTTDGFMVPNAQALGHRPQVIDWGGPRSVNGDLVSIDRLQNVHKDFISSLTIESGNNALQRNRLYAEGTGGARAPT